MTRWAQHQDDDRGFLDGVPRAVDTTEAPLDAPTEEQYPPPLTADSMHIELQRPGYATRHKEGMKRHGQNNNTIGRYAKNEES